VTPTSKSRSGGERNKPRQVDISDGNLNLPDAGGARVTYRYRHDGAESKEPREAINLDNNLDVRDSHVACIEPRSMLRPRYRQKRRRISRDRKAATGLLNPARVAQKLAKLRQTIWISDHDHTRPGVIRHACIFKTGANHCELVHTNLVDGT
jgi:hypothetical protein